MDATGVQPRADGHHAPDIVIIGGSLSGLMHGIVAKRLGYNVTILEQDESTSREAQAAGIGSLYHSKLFLEEHDHLRKDHPYFIPGDGFKFVSRTGWAFLTLRKPAMDFTSWSSLYFRLRANFDALKSETCPWLLPTKPSDGIPVYLQGKKATSVQPVGDLIEVRYSDKNGESSIRAERVLVADGSSSAIRTALQPQVQRTYAGYVSWRGTVLESELTEPTRQAIGLYCNFFMAKACYFVIYTVPGENGTLAEGKRWINFVWYQRIPEGSAELDAIMTGVDGKRYRTTLPAGKMRPEVWETQKAFAVRELTAPVAELVTKTTQPFVASITDVASTKSAFFGGKVLVVGDALSTVRPHLAGSTNQAAFSAMLLARLLRQEIGTAEWEQQVLDMVQRSRLSSIAWGTWFFYSWTSWFGHCSRYYLVMAWQRLRALFSAKPKAPKLKE